MPKIPVKPMMSRHIQQSMDALVYNNLNMNKIESRPIEGRTWEYRFFIDFDGNLADSAVKNAFRHNNKTCGVIFQVVHAFFQYGKPVGRRRIFALWG